MDLAKLFSNSKDAKLFPAGSTIFEQGQPRDYMYIVQEGELEIIHDGKAVETVARGGIVGEMALIDNSKRSATVKAKTDATLVLIDARRFEFLISETPYFAIHVMRVLADRLRRTTDRAK